MRKTWALAKNGAGAASYSSVQVSPLNVTPVAPNPAAPPETNTYMHRSSSVPTVIEMVCVADPAVLACDTLVSNCGSVGGGGMLGLGDGLTEDEGEIDADGDVLELADGCSVCSTTIGGFGS